MPEIITSDRFANAALVIDLLKWSTEEQVLPIHIPRHVLQGLVAYIQVKLNDQGIGYPLCKTRRRRTHPPVQLSPLLC